MSWDISLVIDTGGDSPAEVCNVGNYTWNVSKMYLIAFGGIGLAEAVDNQSATSSIPKLQQAITYMEDHADEMRALNPSNGWGDYEGALAFLKKILTDCLSHPKTTVSVF